MKFRNCYLKFYMPQIFADGEPEAQPADGRADTEETPGTPPDNGQEPKYTDADLDRIINARFAKWQKQQEKRISEAEKLAGMNAQERAEHERDALQKQLDEYIRKDTLAEMSKTARKMLSEDSVTVPDELLSMLVTDDADSTRQNVQAFSKLFKAAVQDAVKAALRGAAPKTGSSGGEMTKEQILKVTDRAQRQKLIAEHIDLFM